MAPVSSCEPRSPGSSWRRSSPEQSGDGSGPPGEADTPAGAGTPERSPARRPGPEPPAPRRYHGSVQLDPTRVGRDASQIAEEVIAHLVGLAGADVTVTVEIDARLPDGASEHVVRTVTENGRTLRFDDGSGFESA